ncbi:hypothetical protein BDP81DRAFT_184069 [Colletotrichum phormii]|uniref:Uncharacterized protein n=1 Tax=Colletotrichum phormii TaxID=359342 RepID=A0AAJ0A0A8_9PEZI|nr:uncharacterized protein BDP81DRAFT_184069 [Colletotrichum phormii]KAK1639812.1 hypothetical protein BDP81DRAFT_184069 [Colletotrichum phormii]
MDGVGGGGYRGIMLVKYCRVNSVKHNIASPARECFVREFTQSNKGDQVTCRRNISRELPNACWDCHRCCPSWTKAALQSLRNVIHNYIQSSSLTFGLIYHACLVVHPRHPPGCPVRISMRLKEYQRGMWMCRWTAMYRCEHSGWASRCNSNAHLGFRGHTDAPPYRKIRNHEVSNALRQVITCRA